LAVTVQIFGSSYTIRSDEDPATIRSVAASVDTLMQEMAEATGLTESIKVAVLSAIHLADDLRQVRAELAELTETLSGTSRSCDDLLSEFQLGSN